MEHCSMLCASLDGRGVWGRMDTCICICTAESLHCLPETTTTLLIGYTPVQIKHLKLGEENSQFETMKKKIQNLLSYVRNRGFMLLSVLTVTQILLCPENNCDKTFT